MRVGEDGGKRSRSPLLQRDLLFVLKKKKGKNRENKGEEKKS
jgi:hypothetical protein